jgi:rSAM/selenodomain-associated transferase 1
LRAALLVIAKAPVPGRVKTRLTPPCSPEQAARLASAALADTLAAVDRAAGGRRRVLVLDGPAVALPAGGVPAGWEVLPQRGDGLAERLACAFADAGAPALLVGMDTPQLTAQLLAAGLAALEDEGADAVLGAATDGGYWAIGLRVADARVFSGVPMSVETTGAAQRERLRGLGLRTAELPPLLDVDTIDAAREVAAIAPGSRFAAELAGIEAAVLA